MYNFTLVKVMGGLIEHRIVFIIQLISILQLSSIVLADTKLEYSEADQEDLTQVITPTKLRQPIHDSPSSVSVITGELMMDLGIKTVPEALRLVPGMAVSMASGNDYRISYHGTNALLPRRMLVLVDGIPVYRFGIARVDWTEFPVLVDQIDRIEVTRSASGTTYGANSFLAVVNVFTKNPLEYGRPNIRVTGGSLNTKTIHISYGSNLADTDYQLSYSNQASNGFDENYLGKDRRDALNLNRFSYKGITEISSDINLETQFLSTFGEIQNEFADNYQANYPDIESEDYLASADITYDIAPTNQLKLGIRYISSERKQNWTTCPPAIVWLKEMRALFLINPELAQQAMTGVFPDPSTLTPEESTTIYNLQLKLNELGSAAYSPICADVNQNNKDEQSILSIYDTYVLSDELRAVSGLSLSDNTFTSDTYMGGSYTTSRYFAMTNIEYKPTSRMVFNFGAVLEDEKRLSGGPFTSYRGGLNFHIMPSQTIRFGYSEAIRTPDLLEENRKWNMYGENYSSDILGYTEGLLYFQSTNNTKLIPEKIKDIDLGYIGTFQDLGLNIDFKIFRSILEDLISERIDFLNLESLTNNGEATLYGAELQMNYSPSPRTKAGLTYSYMKSDTNNFYEETLFSKHKGSIYVSQLISPTIDMSLMYIGTSKTNGSPYGRFDFIAHKKLSLGGNKFKIEFKASHHVHEQKYAVNPTFEVDNKYASPTHYFMSFLLDI